MTKQNHKAEMKNANKGKHGQNITHAQNQDNRGRQLNPNNKLNDLQKQRPKAMKP